MKRKTRRLIAVKKRNVGLIIIFNWIEHRVATFFFINETHSHGVISRCLSAFHSFTQVSQSICSHFFSLSISSVSIIIIIFTFNTGRSFGQWNSKYTVLMYTINLVMNTSNTQALKCDMCLCFHIEPSVIIHSVNFPSTFFCLMGYGRRDWFCFVSVFFFCPFHLFCIIKNHCRMAEWLLYMSVLI